MTPVLPWGENGQTFSRQSPEHGLEETSDGGFTTALGYLFQCLIHPQIENISLTV